MFKRKFTSPGLPGPAQKAIDQLQHRTADYLNERSSQMPAGQMKVMLLLFCLVMGGASLFLAIKGIMPANGPPVIKRTKMSIPKLIPDSIKIHPLKNK